MFEESETDLVLEPKTNAENIQKWAGTGGKGERATVQIKEKRKRVVWPEVTPFQPRENQHKPSEERGNKGVRRGKATLKIKGEKRGTTGGYIREKDTKEPLRNWGAPGKSRGVSGGKIMREEESVLSDGRGNVQAP